MIASLQRVLERHDDSVPHGVNLPVLLRCVDTRLMSALSLDNLMTMLTTRSCTARLIMGELDKNRPQTTDSIIEICMLFERGD